MPCIRGHTYLPFFKQHPVFKNSFRVNLTLLIVNGRGVLGSRVDLQDDGEQRGADTDGEHYEQALDVRHSDGRRAAFLLLLLLSTLVHGLVPPPPFLEETLLLVQHHPGGRRG